MILSVYRESPPPKYNFIDTDFWHTHSGDVYVSLRSVWHVLVRYCIIIGDYM